jgi:hypothetical protein
MKHDIRRHLDERWKMLAEAPPVTVAFFRADPPAPTARLAAIISSR